MADTRTEAERHEQQRSESLNRILERLDQLTPEDTKVIVTPANKKTSRLEAWYSPSVILTMVGLLSAGAAGAAGAIVHLNLQLTELYRKSIEADARAAEWIPQIRGVIEKANSVETVNKIQHDRIDNLVDAIRDLRTMNNNVAQNISQIKEDVAVIKGRMGLDKRTENIPQPRDR